jgi:hypothetical protein
MAENSKDKQNIQDPPSEETREGTADGQPEQNSKCPPLRQHEIVERLLPNPADFPARSCCIYGFLGKDSEIGFWRIYLDLNLDHYIRVAEADIVTVRDAERDAETSPRSQRLDEVWVRQDADLTETHVIPKQMRTSFLSGSLVNRLSSAAYDDVTPRYYARRSAYQRAAARPPVYRQPVTIVGMGCDPGVSSYSTGCYISADCGTYGFGCSPTGPPCIPTFVGPACGSMPSVCLCDTRHGGCD